MIAKLPNGNDILDDYEFFSDIDFIVTDLDGTLIAGGDNVLTQIKRDIHFLRRYQVQITIATGRTYAGAQSLMQEIDLKIGMPVALYNGSVVVEYGTDKVLYCNPIKYDMVKKLVNYINLSEANIYIYTFAIENLILIYEGESRIKERVYGLGKRRCQKDINGLMIEWLDGLKMINEPILAILIEKENINKDENDRVEAFFKSNLDIIYTDSGNGFIEVKGQGLNKGIIIQILKQKYKFNKILAIGDNDNDKELFENADISVAVEDSSFVAIENADYICENKSAEGFWDMLEVIKKAKKYYKKEKI